MYRNHNNEQMLEPYTFLVVEPILRVTTLTKWTVKVIRSQNIKHHLNLISKTH